MKYKQLKPISLELLWNAQPDKGCHEFLVEWAAFMNWASRNIEASYGALWTKSQVKCALDNLEDRGHGDVFLSYAKDHGFIEREFEPFDLVIPIESEDEADAVRTLLENNCHDKEIRKMSRQVNVQLRKRGMKF